MDNIKLENSVRWGNSCQDCVGCTHHRLKESIEIIGFTEGKRR